MMKICASQKRSYTEHAATTDIARSCRIRYPTAVVARVAELADAQDLGSCGETRGGSTPLSRTTRLRPESFRGYGSARQIFQSCSSADFCYRVAVVNGSLHRSTGASVAQSGRASRCQRECRGFKSLRSLQFFQSHFVAAILPQLISDVSRWPDPSRELPWCCDTVDLMGWRCSRRL